jgi:hypothetical protein
MTIDNQSLDQRLNTLDKATDDVAMMVQDNNPMETTEEVLNEDVVEQDPLQVADDPVFSEVEPTYVSGNIPK